LARRIKHQDMSRRNRAEVLSLIRRTGALSRMQLAQQLRLSPAALTKIASELLEAGILRQEPVLDLSPSQPRALLNLNPDWGHVLTVSITYNLAVGIVDLSGKVVEMSRLAGDDGTHDLYRDSFEDLLLPAVRRLLERWGTNGVFGIGVLSYGTVDRNGVILDNSELPDKNVDIRRVLSGVTKLPVYVDEESRLLLLARQWSRAKPLSTAVAISCRMSGFGGNQALLINGRLHYGLRGLAGEPGWAVPVPHLPETWNAAMAAVGRMGGKEAYLEKLGQGAPEALNVYRLSIENFGYRVALMANLINPEAVFLFTDYLTLGEPFLDGVMEEARKHAAPMNLEGMQLLFGGRRSDEERLAAAALPVLAQVFEEGLFDALPKTVSLGTTG